MKAKAKAQRALVRVGFGASITAASLFAFPVLAFASEEAAAEAKSGIDFLLPDMLEFLPMLVSFILLASVLWKFGWPVFEGMLEKRESTIRESLEKSEAARIESERILEEYKRQLADAKNESARIIADAKQAAEAMSSDITSKAQAEAANMIAKAKFAIDVEKKTAIAELQGSIADISVAVASRLIGGDLSEDEHRALIERYVNEAGSFNAN